jgi:hypothetical protein
MNQTFQRHSARKTALYYLSLAFILMTISFLYFAFNPLRNPFISNAKATSATTYHVSRSGNNTSGLSWGTAWNELNQINWSVIQPGDTIVLDGGLSSMTYTTTLTIGKSGTAGHPITIMRASVQGHNGTIDLFGGRSTPLPYCGQAAYTFQTRGVLPAGIAVGDDSYIVIDGGSWHGITIYGDNGSGVVFGSNSRNDVVRNLQIYDDGTASRRAHTLWYPWGPYLIDLHGKGHTFQYLDLHDGGEDAFQPTNLDGITVQLSWLHDTRANPSHPGTAFNQCNHNDGMQIWTGHPVTQLTFDQDVIGPEKENDLILGNGLVAVSNVKITNTLLMDAGANNIWGSPAEHWTIDHVTSFAQNQNLIIDGSGHSVTNSIFYGGLMSFHNSIANSANNCQWQTSGNTLQGQTTNPQFASDLSSIPLGVSSDVRQSPTIALLSGLDFSLRPSSPCKGLGSSITSIQGFLQLVGGGSPISQPNPSSTQTPTQKPVVIAGSGSVNSGSAHSPDKATAPTEQPEGANWVIPIVLAISVVTLLSMIVYKRLRR